MRVDLRLLIVRGRRPGRVTTRGGSVCGGVVGL